MLLAWSENVQYALCSSITGVSKEALTKLSPQPAVNYLRFLKVDPSKAQRQRLRQGGI